jgi:hypothetical protein
MASMAFEPNHHRPADMQIISDCNRGLKDLLGFSGFTRTAQEPSAASEVDIFRWQLPPYFGQQVLVLI